MASAEIRSSIAKIDAHRARKLGEMLVTRGSEFREPKSVLFDLASQDARQLLETYNKTRASYATSPFDPQGSKLKFYDRGYTIWSGYPGAGKTTAIRQLVCHLLNAQHKVFVASLEEHPVDVIVHLAGVAFGREVPTQDQLQWFIDYYSDSLRIWGSIGVAKREELMGTMQQLASEGVRHAVIDSLMCLDISSQDWEGHRVFANLLNSMAIESNLHIHLIAHPRKAVSVEQEADINDIAGGADYGRLAHNVVFVRREKTQAGYNPDLGGMRIAIRKQRYGSGYIGNIDGWLDRRIRQFKLEQFQDAPTQYLPKAAYEREKCTNHEWVYSNFAPPTCLNCDEVRK